MCIGMACMRITLGRSSAGMVGVRGHKSGEVSFRCCFVVLSSPKQILRTTVNVAQLSIGKGPILEIG
jgi:hypothetical protein